MAVEMARSGDGQTVLHSEHCNVADEREGAAGNGYSRMSLVDGEQARSGGECDRREQNCCAQPSDERPNTGFIRLDNPRQAHGDEDERHNQRPPYRQVARLQGLDALPDKIGQQYKDLDWRIPN